MGGGSLGKDKETKEEESERQWQVQKSMALQNPRQERVLRKEEPPQVGVYEEIRNVKRTKAIELDSWELTDAFQKEQKSHS